MAQVISFFPRQALVSGGNVDIYSEIIDVSDYSQIVMELRLYSYSGAGALSATLQDCMDPAFNPSSVWSDVASVYGSAAGQGLSFTASNLKRFARAKITLGSTNAIIGFEGVGRSTT